jgi:hypothetical protein
MKFIILMPGKIKQFIVNNRRFFITTLLIAVGIFFVGKSVGAGIIDTAWDTLTGQLSLSDFLSSVVAYLALLFVNLLGSLFVEMVSVLIDIAKFNQFITLDIVKTGWGLARDIANMFFIVVLLIIAFSTVLKISSYHYQKTLFKLVIMAVLVNFSKLIAGFLIDFFQVIMLTFVNGFKDVLGGNFAEGFGLYKMLSLADTATNQLNTNVDYAGIAVAAVVSLILILVADMTILIMAAVLLWRIAMLWVLVIISPLAYLSYAIMPKYWSQWWQMFFQHLVSGPVIAFFLWLSLLTIQQQNIADQFTVSGTPEEQKKQIETIFLTDINNKLFLQYMVMLALLMGGLTISQKIASQSGSAVGNFAQKVQKYGTRAVMVGSGAAAVGWLATKGAPEAYQWGARKIAKGTKGRSDLFLRPIRTLKKFREGQKHMAELENLEIEAEAGKVLEKGGVQGLVFGAASKDFAYNLHGFLGVKGMYGIVRGKAQTARSIAADIEKKREEQQKHMEVVNRPDATRYFLNQLESRKDEVGFEDLYEKNNTLSKAAELGDAGAQRQLEENARNYLDKEYIEMRKEKELLEAGGLDKAGRDKARETVDTNNKEKEDIKQKMILAANQKDTAQLNALQKIHNELSKENQKLEALINAKNPADIQKALSNNIISQTEVDKNKEDNKLLLEGLATRMKENENITNPPSKAEKEDAKQKVDQANQEIKKLEDQLKKVGSYIPQAYYSRQAGRSAMFEEMKKVETSNEDELIALYNNALRTKNVSKAAAVTMAATKVGHLNEIIQSQKASDDVYADDGKTLLAKKGEYFDSSGEGIHAFIKDNFMKKLGMSKQVAYGYENDYSDMAQEVGHWTFAQTMGVENGQFVQRSRTDQQQAVSIEKSKQDFENTMRRVNRLGWTTERWIDRKDPSKGRTTILNEEGIDAIRTNFPAIAKSIGKERFNSNLALNLTTKYNMQVLDQIGKSLPEREKADWDIFVESLLKFVNKTKKEAQTDIAVGQVQGKKLDLAKEIRTSANIDF